MANHDKDQWVDDRLAGLGDRDWAPNAERAFDRLQGRSLRQVLRSRRWIWTALAAGCAYFTLLMLPSSRACAEEPGPCVLRVLGVAPTPSGNFKEIGNASAPVTLEIYFDYQYGPCGRFVRDVVPQLMEKYVDGGKVRLVYRDFPLPSHAYARLAARYADSAGELGYYERAMKQIFATQPFWSVSGDLDSALTQVLPSSVMGKVRERIRRDRNPIGQLAGDLAMGQADRVVVVPAVVVVSGGRREILTDSPLSLAALEGRLDQLTK